MLVELAIGDAYGAGFEYADPAFVTRNNTLGGYVRHPRHHGIAPGAYTDDTQLTLALAELRASGVEWTPESVASAFVTAFHRDPREGYARGFQAFLGTVRTGAEFLARIRPDSDKSGAAMRASPAGLLPTVAEVLAYRRHVDGAMGELLSGLDAVRAVDRVDGEGVVGGPELLQQPGVVGIGLLPQHERLRVGGAQGGGDDHLGLPVGDGHEIAGMGLGGHLLLGERAEAWVDDLLGGVLQEGQHGVGVQGHAAQPVTAGRAGVSRGRA